MARLPDFDWPQSRHPWRAVRPSGSCASCRLRRPGTRILSDCACHPWRGFRTSIGPSPAIPGGPFGPQEAALPVGCADRVRAFCQIAHAIHGAASGLRLAPVPPSLAGRSALRKLRFLSAAPTGYAHSVRLRMPSMARLPDFDWPQSRHPWRAVRPSGSCASCRLRRPGLTPSDTELFCVLRRRRFLCRRKVRCPGRRRLRRAGRRYGRR